MFLELVHRTWRLLTKIMGLMLPELVHLNSIFDQPKLRHYKQMTVNKQFERGDSIAVDIWKYPSFWKLSNLTGFLHTETFRRLTWPKMLHGNWVGRRVYSQETTSTGYSLLNHLSHLNGIAIVPQGQQIGYVTWNITLANPILCYVVQYRFDRNLETCGIQ
jgi:hypothetical protein